MFEYACSHGMGKLLQEPWAGVLDSQVYARGFLEGAKFLFDTRDSEPGNVDAEASRKSITEKP
jgi:hypothetical protein